MQNNTDSEISDVTVTFPGTIPRISAASRRGVEDASDNEWNVSEDMLDTDLTFGGLYRRERQYPNRQDGIADNHEKKSTVAATATASVSKDTIEKGDKVKFTFKLKNEGNVTLEKASLKAPPLSDGGNSSGKPFPSSRAKPRS